MMKKQTKLLSLTVLGLLLIAVGLWSVPLVLRALPSRYVARLPKPFQELALPANQAPLLPTVAVTADISLLLHQTAVASPTPMALAAVATFPPAPNTPTPPAVEGITAVALLPATYTPVPSVSPTPLPPTPTATPVPLPPTARLDNIHHKFQTWNNCGPATLAMTLTYFGIEHSQEETAAFMKPDPEDRNVTPAEMVAYVQEMTDLTAVNRINGTPQIVRQLLANQIPVIFELGIDPPGEYAWMGWYGHYLLAMAYDDPAQEFRVYDSWFGTSDSPLTNADNNGRSLTYADLAVHWPQFNRSYIAVYRPDQAELVAQIIGPDMDDQTMWQDSLATAQSDASSDPTNAFYWFNLGSSYNALGQYDKAASAFDQARAIGLPWRMLWYQFGPYEAYYQVGRYEDVLLLADTTLKDRPYFEESFYYKGLALQALGQVDEARDNLQEAADFNPHFTAAVTALSQLP